MDCKITILLLFYYPWLYEDTTTKVYKYLATADIEIRNFRKIRFSPVKIKVIRRIAIHPAIRASYNAFLFGR
jgi:hypothetical protein